ncbi:MAG: glutamate-5-semialdehyde dehydrogenase [Chloroflexota bacterium]
MEKAMLELEEKARAAKAASQKLAFVSSKTKDSALLAVARALREEQGEILAANEADFREAEASGMGVAMLDRLRLTPERLDGISRDVVAVAALPDPVGEVFDMKTLPNGLVVGKKRVPLGVIAAIYESRPNVTVDISMLCLKSGNSVILRGGRETRHSNVALVDVISSACCAAGVPAGAVALIESPERTLVNRLLKMNDVISLLIPRGGAELIDFVRQNATMPVVAGGIGVCHTYVDKLADLAKAVAIVYNAKVQRPTVCNALDCILVHREIASSYLPLISRELAKSGVEMRCDERALAILQAQHAPGVKPAEQGDWGKEYLALIAAVRIVDSLDQALEHISQYGSGHSEAIVSEDYSAVMRFLDEVDAACVYANASTRFTDGGQFGLGTEVGISTQKIHARGPMGLEELTSYKWIIFGSGQVRS